MPPPITRERGTGGHGGIRLDTALERLRGLDWRKLGVRVAVLFGSTPRQGWGHDIDLLVDLTGNTDPDALLHTTVEASEAVSGPVDVVALREAPCPVILDAWRHGVIVYERRRGEALELLLQRLLVCLDYELMARRLGLTRVAVRAALRRWGEAERGRSG